MPTMTGSSTASEILRETLFYFRNSLHTMSAGNPTNKWRSSELRCSCCRGYGFHPPQTDKQHPQHSIDPLRLASGPVENEALGVLMSVRGRQSLSSQSEHPFSCSCTAHCSFSLTNTTHSFGFINTSSFLRLNPNDRVSKKRIICLTKTSSRFDFPLAFSENPQTAKASKLDELMAVLLPFQK